MSYIIAIHNLVLVSQIPLICETKPMISIQQMRSYQSNGCFQPQLVCPSKPKGLSPDVARLVQLEEGIRPERKHKKSTHHAKRKYQVQDRDHCTIDINGFETNV